MSKITSDHLARKAIVYVRQSSEHQVRHNIGSQEWQYGLEARAGVLGWAAVTFIDQDLGLSGGGSARRAGFKIMLDAVCNREVGIILSVDATRLSRNGREWHTLLEFCGIVGCLLADEQTVYDPRVVFCVKSEWLSRINLIGVGQNFPHCSVFSGWTVLHRALGCSGPE